jgi:hypothetical protein
MSTVPAWVRRRPMLLAGWFIVHNVLQMFRSHRYALPMSVGALVAIVGVIVILVSSRELLASWWPPLADYGLWLALAAMTHASFAASRRRRAAEASQRRSWLTAAPIPARQIRIAVFVRVLAPLAAQAVGALAIVTMCALAANATRALVVQTDLLVLAGFVIGALLGLFWRRRQAQARAEDSRYVRMPAVSATPLAPSLDGLARWPIAQTLAWHRPENLRVLLVVGMLAVQAGSSALHGLCVVAVWLFAGYLAALVSATRRTALDAARWLRSTPLGFGQFAWTLARRPLLHQLIGTIVLAGGLCALGSNVLMAAYLAAVWLSLVVMLSAIWLAAAYLGRSPTLKVALSIATFAGVEVRGHAWAIPFAIAMTAWHVRAGARR